MHLKCTCGLQSLSFTDTCSVGDMVKGSRGWQPVFTHDTGIIWLCTVCYEKANKLAKQLLEIMKDEQFYFPNLVHKSD